MTSRDDECLNGATTIEQTVLHLNMAFEHHQA